MIEPFEYPVGVATRPGMCPIAQETAQAAPMLCTEYDPNGWMEYGMSQVEPKLIIRGKRVKEKMSWKLL